MNRADTIRARIDAGEYSNMGNVRKAINNAHYQLSSKVKAELDAYALAKLNATQAPNGHGPIKVPAAGVAITLLDEKGKEQFQRRLAAANKAYYAVLPILEEHGIPLETLTQDLLTVHAMAQVMSVKG